MTLIRASQPDAQPPPERKRYRSDEEIKMRDMLEVWARPKWPGARIVHELVVGRGEARADMAVICPAHLVAIEIKSSNDTTTRLVSQICMFRLVAPELWVAVADRHTEDVEVVRYLIPSLGCLTFPQRPERWADEITGDPAVTQEAAQFQPHQESMLRVLWVAELHAEAVRHRLVQGAKPPTHDRLVQLMMKLGPEERLRSVCRQLRMRNAMWRADPPLSAEAA